MTITPPTTAMLTAWFDHLDSDDVDRIECEFEGLSFVDAEVLTALLHYHTGWWEVEAA